MKWRQAVVVLIVIAPGLLSAQPVAQYFGKSYAVVIGIRDYQHPQYWSQLKNNHNDADEMARILESQGFAVKLLKGRQATKQAIESYLVDDLAPALESDDRLLFYFSGHGETSITGAGDFGNIIPYDATNRVSTWIAMDRLRNLAERLGAARHQLFIFDACFGGAFGLKGSLSAIPEDRPNYTRVVADAKARQYLTAGGAKERTPAHSNLAGYKSYSFYTAHLIKAFREDKGDLNADGVITASELDVYLSPAASSQYNVPRGGSFPGHEQGNFVFQTTRAPIPRPPNPSIAANVLKGPTAPSQNRYIEPEMVEIPGGRFQMGSPESEADRWPDEALHWVEVDDFEIGKYEVTVAEYRKFKEAGGSGGEYAGCRWDDPGFEQTEKDPVVCVRWEDAQRYIAWLNEETGGNYRLPTEAEWEYAARAGTQTARYWGESAARQCDYANGADKQSGLEWAVDCDDGFKNTAPVDAEGFLPNGFGLYHMLGNVWEWTDSLYSEVGAERVVRGGSWIDYARLVRCAFRNPLAQVGLDAGMGFRCARVQAKKGK